MESKSFEEKFSIFFNQFDNDTEIEFLFNFLEIVIIQYKADPRKVCDFLRRDRIKAKQIVTKNVQDKQVQTDVQPVVCSQQVTPRPTKHDDQSDQTIDIEIISSDECEQENMSKTAIKDPIKREPISHDENSRSKKLKKKKTESHDFDNNVDNLNSNLNKTLVESIHIISNSLLHNTVELSSKEEWLNLFYETIESDENCRLVLIDLNVLKYFKEFIKFNNSQVTRYMMSILINIAGVKSLRIHFFKNDIIKIFHTLLTDSTSSISYRSLQLLVHLISEGAEAWQTEDCVLADRNKIIENIDNLIEKWKARNFKVMFTGRQLDDIVEFLNSFDNSICQKWSCWILSQAHFKPSESQKERILASLKQILADLRVDKSIKTFAKLALNRALKN